MSIKESDLTTISTMEMNDFVRTVTQENSSSKVLLSAVAQVIVENYKGSLLGGSARSIKDAVDSIKSFFESELQNVKNALNLYSDQTVTAEGSLRIRKVFNAVQVNYRGTPKDYNKAAYNLIYTLPEGFRPSDTINFVAYNNNTNYLAQAFLAGYINPSGQIYVWVYNEITGQVAPHFNVTFLKSGSMT